MEKDNSTQQPFAGCKLVSFEAAKKDRDAEFALLEILLGEDYVRALQPTRSGEPAPVIPLR